MKPFNLAEAQAGAPLQTREGNPVKFVAYVPEMLFENRKVITFRNGDLYSAAEDGTHGYDRRQDLFMAPLPYEPTDAECDALAAGSGPRASVSGAEFLRCRQIERHALKVIHELKERIAELEAKV